MNDLLPYLGFFGLCVVFFIAGLFTNRYINKASPPKIRMLLVVWWMLFSVFFIYLPSDGNLANLVTILLFFIYLFSYYLFPSLLFRLQSSRWTKLVIVAAVAICPMFLISSGIYTLLKIEVSYEESAEIGWFAGFYFVFSALLALVILTTRNNSKPDRPPIKT